MTTCCKRPLITFLGWSLNTGYTVSTFVKKLVYCHFRSGESASCTIVFILVYYFTIAGVTWFVMLAYSWDITFKAIGTVRDDLSKKTAYFHIISWCLPLVMTIVILSISEVIFVTILINSLPNDKIWALTK